MEKSSQSLTPLRNDDWPSLRLQRPRLVLFFSCFSIFIFILFCLSLFSLIIIYSDGKIMVTKSSITNSLRPFCLTYRHVASIGSLLKSEKEGLDNGVEAKIDKLINELQAPELPFDLFT